MTVLIFSFKKTCSRPSQVRWAEERSWYPAGIYLSFGIISNEETSAYLLFPSLLFPDKNGSKNLGKFVSSPTSEKGYIQLSYSDGDDCGSDKKITTNITLVCKPGTVTQEGGSQSPSSLQWGGMEGAVLSTTSSSLC